MRHVQRSLNLLIVSYPMSGTASTQQRMRWMRVPSYCGALWASIRYLLIGFLSGVYLLYGWSYAVVPNQGRLPPLTFLRPIRTEHVAIGGRPLTVILVEPTQ